MDDFYGDPDGMDDFYGEPIEFLDDSTVFCHKYSCHQRCGEMAGKCSCDVSCIIYNTCCLDFVKYCHHSNGTGNRNDTRDLLETLPPASPVNPYASCTLAPNAIERELEHYILVNRCPNNTDKSLKDLCQNLGNHLDLSKIIPISDNITSIQYANIHCATCHGVHYSRIKPWQPQFNCVQKEDQVHLHDLNIKSRIYYLMKECLITFKLPRNAQAAICNFAISSCPASHKPKRDIGNRLDLQDACNRYSSPLIIDNTQYRNPHCALCNDKSLYNAVCEVRDPGGITRPYVSYSLLVDFTESSGMQMMFPQNSVDTLTICPPNNMLLDDRCVSANVTHNCVPQPPRSNNTQYFIYYSEIGSYNYFEDMIRMKMFTYKTLDGAVISKWNNSEYRNCSKHIDASFFRGSPCPSHTMQFNGTIEMTFINDLTVHMSNRFKWDTDYFYLTNYEIGQNLNCTYGVRKTYMSGDLEDRLVNYTQFILVKPTETLYKLQDILFGINIMTDVRDNVLNKTNMWVNVCETAIRNCTKIYIGPREFKITSDGVLVVTKTGDMTSHFELCDETAVICIESFKRLPGFQNKGTPSTLQGKLSFAGNCLSEFCLGITIIVHILLSPLRTIPGRSVMALSLSLFLAQLLFQISGLPLKLSAGCFVVAVLQHYFWLSSFCWMMVLAFDLRSTFANTIVVKDLQKRRKLFLLYNAYAWSVPIVIIVICLFLHFLTDMNIYDNNNICWINGSRNLLYFFVIPIGVALLVNLVLFVLCVIGLYRTNKATQLVRKTTKWDLIVYLKISTLMGFTWLSGFLANAVQQQWFWYVFIVCNTLQGVSISVAFALNPRVFRLVRDRMRQKRELHSHATAVTALSKLSD